MSCCALGPCTDPACPICVELPRRFPPIVRCPHVLDDGKKRVQCRYITGHRLSCAPGPRTRGDTHSREHWWRDDLPGDR